MRKAHADQRVGADAAQLRPRDQVLEVCPELSRYSQASAGIQKTFEGSSLETIRHMVAAGIGITVLPWTAMPAGMLVDG
ncbi:MAG: hypothetical protein ACKOPO_04030, partial [Novosphingobium sp.]